jgi:Leucine-rich repeat (LRR) protein
MKNFFLTFTISLTSFYCFGQKNKTFKTLEEMKAVHPDSVYNVELENYHGQSLPEWLFDYKNVVTFKIIGTSQKQIPLSDLTGISKFVNLYYLNVSFTSIAEISSELASMKITTLILSGVKINTFKPLFEAMVKSNGESFIYGIDGVDKTNILEKEELKLFNKISSDGGYFWETINGKSVKLRRYNFRHYDVKKYLEKMKAYLKK